MRVHYLQHVPFEGIGSIEEWAALRGHVLTGTEMFRTAVAPAPGLPPAAGAMPRPVDAADPWPSTSTVSTSWWSWAAP